MRASIRLINIILLVVVLTLVSQGAVALEVQEPASGPPGLSGKPVGNMAKASSALRRALVEFDAHVQQGKQGSAFAPSNQYLQVSRGKIMIDAVAAGDVNVLRQELQALGLENIAQYGAVVSGMMPLGKIRHLLSLNSLRSAAAAWRPITNVGAVTSEGVAVLGADLLRTGDENTGVYQDGYTGSGVKIGVLSDSYGHRTDAPTATDDQASNDLPPSPRIDILDDSANCGSVIAPAACSDEGRAMKQLIYDVAPGVDFAFHTAFASETHFANGIQALADSGAHIIVDDVLYFAEPMFQDGIVAQAVNNVVSQGVAYFSSAGNQAKKSYEADFEGSGERLTVLTGWLCPWVCQEEDRGELHDFNSGPQIDFKQSITIPAGRTVIFTIQWADPFGSLGGSGAQSDFDMYLVDADMTILASGISDNISSGEPVEIFQFANSGTEPVTYDLLITHFAGPATDTLVKYVIFGGIGLSSEVTGEYLNDDRSTLYGHANAAGAEAVGAVFWNSQPLKLESFSSRGGTPILFEADGTPTFDARADKPEVLGPDGTNTTFFYSDRDGDGWPNFYGTSAAAPHVAAVAALMLEANPSLSPAQIYSALEVTAVELDGQDGFDNDHGHGLVDAVAAVAYVAPTDPPIAYPDGPYLVDEGTSLNINGVLDNDTDPDGGTVTPTTVAVLDTPPAHVQTFTLNDDGTFTYVHDGSETTSDSFTYYASDGGASSDPAMVTITINPVNDPPVADSQAVSTNEDTSVPITLSGSDVDGGALSYIVTSNPSHGDLSGAAPNLTYTPDAGYNGGDSLAFKVNDGNADSNVAIVTITVNAVNNTPVADAQAVSTNEDTSLPITLSGSDADGDALTYAVASGPSNGVLSGTAPNLTYAPNTNFNGADSFTFTVDDGVATSAPATVTITVDAVNDLPVADSQAVSTDEDTSVSITLSGSDVDGDPLTYSVTSGPFDGTLSGEAPNLTYTPTPGYDGADSLTFVVNDGTVNSAPVTVSITVNPVVDPPAGPVTVFEDSFENGSGSNWENWTEDTQGDWFHSTQRSVDGGNSAEVDGRASDAQLISIPIDLQGRQNATITFSWYIERGLDSGEYLAFDVLKNGSASWVEQARLRGNQDQENFWHQVSIDLTNITSLQLRFRGNMSRGNEDANVDMITVTAY